MSSTIPSLQRSISPPARRTKRRAEDDGLKEGDKDNNSQPSLAAIEAGEARIRNHLEYFSKRLQAVARPVGDDKAPRLSIDDFIQLYKRNDHEHGRHFVVHQHNHPVAGVHYDLRLQFSGSSTVSWAIPYGLPGDPNSRRQGRMAIETRIHNLWNNLIESASHATGSLLIWDTGEYEVLPRRAAPAATDDEDSDGSAPREPSKPEHQKLVEGFQGKYLRLRLRGTKLPKGYTITLRLPSGNDTAKEQPKAPSFKRRRVDTANMGGMNRRGHVSTDSESDIDTASPISLSPGRRRREEARFSATSREDGGEEVALASEDEHVNEAETIRKNNAYTGAHNTIGSIHQRHWYLSLDRTHSGFSLKNGMWAKDGEMGFDKFHVHGAEIEHSVITGRLSREVMNDDGVQGFQPRKMWRPITK